MPAEGVFDWSVLMKITLNYNVLIILIIGMLLLVGCNGFGVRKTNSALISVGEEKISSAETMIYLLQAKEEFERVGGPDVWEIPKEDFTGGKTPEQVAKERAMDNLIRDKIFVSQAKNLGLSLQEDKISQAKQLAKDYFSKIPENTIKKYNITAEIVEEAFLDFSLAQEVSTSIKNNYEPKQAQIEKKMMEDPDYSKLKGHDPKEILTYVRFKRVLIYTTEINANNERASLSDEEIAEASRQIEFAHKEAKSGRDFDSIIDEFSQEQQAGEVRGEFNISQALLSKELVDAFSKLKINEISPIVTTESGFQFFKIIEIKIPTEQEISNYSAEFEKWEETLRKNAEESLKEKAVTEIYTEWKKDYAITVETEQWDNMSIFNGQN